MNPNTKSLRKILQLISISILIGLSACSAPTASAPTSDLTSPVAVTGPSETPVRPSAPASSMVPPVSSATQPATSRVTPLPPQTPIEGVELHKIDASGGLDLMKQAGAYWIRRNALLWSKVEPEEGQRNWQALAGLETELKNAADQGMQVILIVRSTPAWAQKVPGASCGPVSQDKLNAFASFMHDLVARYSVPPYNVKYWELGNEPDVDPSLVPPDSIFGCWGDANDEYYGGGYYAEMLKAVYPQIKSADPNAQVLTGGLLLFCDPNSPPEDPKNPGNLMDCTPSRFLEGILKNGGGDYFDAVSFHAYDYYMGALGKYNNSTWHSSWDSTGPSLIAKAHYLQGLLDEYDYPNKGLLNTESAVLCTLSEDKCNEDDFANTKAYYLAQAYAGAAVTGLQANIWYSITGWRFSGLVDKGLKPLPAYDAYRFSAQILRKAAFVGQIDQFPDVMGYAYNRDGSRVWILWSLDGQEHTVHLPETASTVYDTFGTSLPNTQDIRVALEPVYIEWQP